MLSPDCQKELGWTISSLRKCIRPLVENGLRAHDDPRVPVLDNRHGCEKPCYDAGSRARRLTVFSSFLFFKLLIHCPRRSFAFDSVAYFIQAPNRNTQTTCGTFQGNTNYCRNATFSDLGELDDRGYIYNMDRAGSGLTILKLTGNALQVVTGQGGGGGEDDH